MRDWRGSKRSIAGGGKSGPWLGRMSHTPAAFTDQAHLIHDFGTIVGGTPAEFFGAGTAVEFPAARMRCQAWPISYNPFIV